MAGAGAITDVAVSVVRLPPASRWEDATHVVGALEFVFVEVATEDGARGTGHGYSTGVGATATAALIEDYVARPLLGRAAADLDGIRAYLAGHLDRTGHGAISRNAIAAVETAIVDLLARSAGVSVAEHLGAERTSIPAYASSIDLPLSADELAADIEGRLARGYRAVKIKVGRPTLAEDVDRVAAARAVLGDEAELLLDANQGWDTEEAIRRVRALERYRPGWIEEPLVPGDIAGHARLRAAVGTPLAVGESLYSLGAFEAYLDAEAVDVLQPDVGRIGGFGPWLAVAHLAAERGRSVSAHYLAELSAHAMCAAPNALLLEDVHGGSLHELGLARAPLVRDGVASLDGMVGHGIELDPEAIAHHAVDRARLRREDTTTVKARAT